MSNDKQSSIEWLIEQLKEYDFSNEDDTYVIKIQSWVLTEKQEQAKKIHKEETIKLYYAYEDYVLREEGIIKTFGQFYNETFGDESNN